MNRPIITSIAPNLVCSDGPYVPMGPRLDEYAYHFPSVMWEPRCNRQDYRPTFAAALNHYCDAHCLSVAALCRQKKVDHSTAYAARNCEYPTSTRYRVELAAMLGMQPHDIRWPVQAKKERSC